MYSYRYKNMYLNNQCIYFIAFKNDIVNYT